MPKSQNFWYAAFAGLCTTLIGIGLCRFAYTPLIPALINQGWLTKAGASYLGTINYAGYMCGAILGMRAHKYCSVPRLIQFNLVLSVVSLALCAINWGFGWLAIWRFLCGMTGSTMIVITPAVILKMTPLKYKARVAGIIFTGMGIGTMVSGFLFPPIAQFSITDAWLAMAGLALIMAALAWPVFAAIANQPVDETHHISIAPIPHSRVFIMLAIGYAFFGISAVPHSLYLVDYVHRELQFDLVKSGIYWAAFGFGAMIGPFLTGAIADRVNLYKTLIGGSVAYFIATTLVLFNQNAVLYFLSALFGGMLIPSIVTLVSSRVMELVGNKAHSKFWGEMTFCFALTQVSSAYGMSYLLHRGVDYMTCFLIAAICILIGTVFVVLANSSAK